jgi:hypothetical protein
LLRSAIVMVVIPHEKARQPRLRAMERKGPRARQLAGAIQQNAEPLSDSIETRQHLPLPGQFPVPEVAIA